MTLQEAAVKTFRVRAVQSVVLIDDEFPKYGQAADAYGDSERALSLHSGFHKRHIPCDIENDPATKPEDGGLGVPERIRKCDLVVLDYHLEETSPEKSVRLLRQLADSRHFNMVVVYTAAPLDEVWFRVASNLRGGWLSPREVFESFEVADPNRLEDLIAELAGEEKLPAVPDVILQKCFGGASGWERGALKEIQSDLIAAGVSGPLLKPFAAALVHREGKRRWIERSEAEGPGDENPREIAGRSGDEARWILSRNLFVAVVSKQPAADETDEVEYLFAGLDAAIRDWNPNPFQVVASEAQNVMELDALPLDRDMLKDDELHAAMAWEITAASDREAGLQAVSDGVLRRLGEGLSDRVRILVNEELDGIDALLRGCVKEAEGAEGTGSETRMARALRLAHVRAEVSEERTLLRLNHHLSSNPVVSDHLTSGSVFEDEQGGHWLCVTPACDMVPGRGYGRSGPIQPGKTFLAMQLRPVPSSAAVVAAKDLGKRAPAEQGRHVFIRDDESGVTTVLEAIDSSSHQPKIEAFASKADPLIENGRFSVMEVRLVKDENTGEETFELKERQCRIVGRLRDAYADRLLHMTGHYLSRIGVDFYGREGTA